MPTDYGTDVSALPDLDPLFADVTGRRVLAEALARRLDTPRGTLFYDPDYGLALVDYLNDEIEAEDLGALEDAIAAECRKDERVFAARASVALDPASATMTVTVTVTASGGPFALVLSVSSLGLALLGVT